MFKSGVVVTAVSQPAVPAGTTDTLAGNLTISETLNGQFKPGQFICVTILPRTSNGARTQDTFIKTTTTNDLPVITTNAASGLLTSSVGTPGCPPSFYYSYYGYPVVPNPGASFSFYVNQQSFGGTLGVITIGNIHLITTADAPTGPVLVDVMGDNGEGGSSISTQTITANAASDATTGSTVVTVSGTNNLFAGELITITGTTGTPNLNGTYVVQSVSGSTFTINLPVPGVAANAERTVGTVFATSSANAAVAFETVVSNAKIGVLPSIKFTVGTAAGATKNATFTAKTKVVKLSKYVTWRFTAPKALSGKIVTIWVSTKLADGTWGAPKALTSRLVDINGNAYFWWKSASTTWVAVSASYAGDSNYAMSVSASPQARWIK